MAFHYKTQGIILNKKDQGEANSVFQVFTKEYGKLTLFATSVRKSTSKLRGGLGLLSLSQLEFIQGKNKKVLVQAIPLCQYLTPLHNPLCLQAGVQIATLVDQHMGEQEQDQKIWDVLTQTLSQLKKGDIPEQVYQLFTPQFMNLAGYGSRL